MRIYPIVWDQPLYFKRAHRADRSIKQSMGTSASLLSKAKKGIARKVKSSEITRIEFILVYHLFHKHNCMYFPVSGNVVAVIMNGFRHAVARPFCSLYKSGLDSSMCS